MADVVESTRFEVELQDSAGLLSKQAGSPYIRDRKAIDGTSKPRVSNRRCPPTERCWLETRTTCAAAAVKQPCTLARWSFNVCVCVVRLYFAVRHKSVAPRFLGQRRARSFDGRQCGFAAVSTPPTRFAMRAT
ncbi:hypothetical protein MRX96_005060 [Rhipicephalus microplus]